MDIGSSGNVGLLEPPRGNCPEEIADPRPINSSASLCRFAAAELRAALFPFQFVFVLTLFDKPLIQLLIALLRRLPLLLFYCGLFQQSQVS